jgi:hypothetical protein
MGTFPRNSALTACRDEFRMLSARLPAPVIPLDAPSKTQAS